MKNDANVIKLSANNIEVIPSDRRLVERCSAQQRIQKFLPSGERRCSPGRREFDIIFMELEIAQLCFAD